MDSTYETGLQDAQQIWKYFRDIVFMLQVLEKPNTLTSETKS